MKATALGRVGYVLQLDRTVEVVLEAFEDELPQGMQAVEVHLTPAIGNPGGTDVGPAQLPPKPISRALRWPTPKI